MPLPLLTCRSIRSKKLGRLLMTLQNIQLYFLSFNVSLPVGRVVPLTQEVLDSNKPVGTL